MKATSRARLFLLAAICAAQPSIETEMLAAHNAVRASLKIAPLKWSDKLAARAQDWANTLVASGKFSHRPKPEYGENLFEITGAPESPRGVVEAWASESEDYDYRSNKCRNKCGHYTQLVWADTRRVGCAVARNSGREVWVCNYDPPGNYVGRRPY
jgi:pathogenesis-related protein 1